MNSCVYFLEGHKFNSEIELDDFLLENYKNKSILGDIVFLKATTLQLPAIIILKEISKKASEIFGKTKGERIYDDDGKTWHYQYPYVGVNEFLKDYVDPDTGKKLFPTVEMDFYFKGLDGKSGRFGAWMKGDFTDDEKKLFFPDGYTDLKIIDNLEYYRKKLEAKWESQCLYGDAIHSVLELFFTEEGDKYIGDRLKEGSITIDEIADKLKNETYKRRDKSTITFSELINRLKLVDTLQLAEELMSNLRSKFGEDAIFFPEFLITGKVNHGSSKSDTLLGYIDLFVLDSKGIPHIIDYKTSPKDYGSYFLVKKNTYTYLLATYGRLLGLAGYNITDSLYLVVPIQLNEFEEVDENKFNFKNPRFKNFSNPSDSIFADITHIVKGNQNIIRNLGDIIYTTFVDNVSHIDLLKTTRTWMQEHFPEYELFKHYKDEEIKQQIEKDGGFLKNKETGKFEWKPKGSKTNYVVIADSPEELFEKVKKYKNNLSDYRDGLVSTCLTALKEAIKNKSSKNINWPKKNSSKIQVNPEWFELEMEKYCDGSWEVCDSDAFNGLKSLGIIVVRSANRKQYDFIRISTTDLKYLHKFGKNTTLMGGIGKSDLYYQSQSNSLALLATSGNIELMETMCAINQLKNIFGDNALVGNILIYDPVHGLGLKASNEELYYNFNLLVKNKPTDKFENNFKKDGIILANKVHLARLKFNLIMAKGVLNKSKELLLRTCMDLLNNSILLDLKDIQLEQLNKLLLILESDEVDKNKKLKNITTNQIELSDDLRSLHNAVVIAIAQLKGINYRLLLEDHAQFGDNPKVWQNGLSGSYIDNPGNLRSETLNLVTKLVTQAWLNLRSGMLKPTTKILNATRKLIKDLGTKDPKKLYSHLYNITDDDILFKNPWTDTSLLDSEKEYLILALEMVNSNRNGIDLSANTEEVNKIKRGYEPLYFRVPLKLGDSKAFGTLLSLLEAFKSKISDLHPKKAFKEAINDLTDEEKNKIDEEKSNLFELINTFNEGDNSNRLEYIKRNGGISAFESDLENILLSYNFAYLLKEVIDEVFPLIKASYIHLAEQGASQNSEFKKDMQYLEEYIRNKIKNESIITPRYRELNKLLGGLRSAASKMVLAFSPVQMFYLTIQGIWNDISLCIRRPDGTDAFTMSNMIKGAKLAFKDLFHFGNSPTILSRVNELYGINDMDINVYAERLKTDLSSWNNWMMKFSSRPDFYNRMTIFNAKMIHDGCYEAHSINKDGELVYDCKKDKRYAAFLNNPNGRSEEVLKAKALYLTAARLFELENAKMPDGSNFKCDLSKPMMLPRAYTTLEAESMKDLSDTIYGYYSSEKKSLIHSTILGSMWMQFKTYWSGKKNLFLQTGGVYLQGKWTLLENESHEKLYYLLDEKGNIQENLPPTTTNTGAPFYLWLGDWKEGILSTYMHLLSGTINDGFTHTIQDMWYNEDPKLRATYLSNIILLAYDLIMWAIIGSAIGASLDNWKDDLEDNSKKDDIIDGFKLAMADIAVKSVKNSFLDFNFIDSIGDPTISWNPFAFSYIVSTSKNIWDGCFGDSHLLPKIANSLSVTRQFKPVFKSIDYNLHN